MSDAAIELSHHEISLLLFALEGGQAAPMPDASSCEEACPVIESVEELLCGGSTLDKKQQLVRHLNNHLREGLIESGMFELMATTSEGLPAEDQPRFQQVSARLGQWSCAIKLESEDRRLIYDSLSRIPRSSWITMPRTMWRLRKKLKPK